MHLGTCTPIPAGEDPDNECEPDSPGSCGKTGFCDGRGLCQLFGAETPCNDGQDICTTGDHCDGQGACVGGQSAPNFTPCTVITTPDYAYDICVHGKCVSPGTCADNSCNAPSFHFPLPDTSQRQCQDATDGVMACPGSPGGVTCADTDYCGQDGQYGWDVAHAASERFTRTGTWEPTVTDNVTGLMWQGCVAGLNASDCTNGTAISHSFADALGYCASSSWGGFKDWHLPDKFEALSLGAFGSANGPDPTVFPSLPTYSAIWTSAISWLMQITYNMSDRVDPGELTHGDYYNSPNLTVCVRGNGTARTAARYSRTTNYEPVVGDSDTGLMWQGCAAGMNGASCATGTATMHNWHDALQYCQAITWGGYDDWYLPNVLELESITDGALVGTAFDATAFPATPTSVTFISATSTADNNGNPGVGLMWCVSFGDGSDTFDRKTAVHAVRCVRKAN